MVGGVEAAFFDLDKTVIASASISAFGRVFYAEGMVNRRSLMRALWSRMLFMHFGASEKKLERMRESVLLLTKGWERAKIQDIVEETLHVTIEPIIYREAIELMAEHKQAGRIVVIISASPEEMVEPIGRMLGADFTIGSRARLDTEGRYTGEMDRYSYGPHKAEFIRQLALSRHVDLAKSYAYSDSVTDLPMLELVGHPVVVNPDRALLKEGRRREWEIRYFTTPEPQGVRLRTATVSTRGWIGASVITGVLGGLGLWWAWTRIGRKG